MPAPNQPINPWAIHAQNWATEMYSEIQKEKLMAKKVPESSQTIYTLQIPAALLESSLESIDRELEEQADALEEITRLLEVVQETDSTIQHHLSNLRTAASQSERKKSRKPPSYPGLSEPEPAGGFAPQTQADLAVAAAPMPLGLEPLLAGQG